MELETGSLACTGIKPGGRCRTLDLLIAYGLQGAPRYRIVRECVRLLFQPLMFCDSKMMAELRVAWSEDYAHLSLDNNANLIRGIMTNIISLLFKAGWEPSNLNCWTDEDDAKWVVSGALVFPDVVAEAIDRLFFNIESGRAANHYFSKGFGSSS